MKKTLSQRAPSQKTPAWRFALVAVLLAIMAFSLLAKALTLQVMDTEYGREFLQQQGDARTVRSEPIPAYRGVISDRNGEPLAVSTPVPSLWINPRQLITSKASWRKLAAAADIDYRLLSQKITKNQHLQFLYLQRRITPEKAERIKRLGIQGVGLRHEYKRYYPAGEVAAHLIGFTNVDDKGQEGIELAYDHWLRGESGRKKVLKNKSGDVFRDIGLIEKAKPGKDLMLSIDMRLQHAAHRELTAAMDRLGARSGSVVMIDCRTGEVLAMANHPSFNPNNRRRLQVENMRNRAVVDMFEPGSTVKPLTVIAALESGRYRPNTKIDTNPGYIRIGKKTLHDPVNYGVLDVAGLLAKSSQVATSKLAMSIDEYAVYDVFNRFGLGVSTDSGFPGESAGILQNRRSWRPIERVNFAFGYGLAVTPLQLARAYSVLGSGGYLYPTSLLKQDQNVAGQQVIEPTIARQMLGMLQAVTADGGTATRARIGAYTVAGKTGTVHKVASSGGYAEDKYIAVFAGMAPATNPRIAAVVMINEPNLDKYQGGVSAAPVFSKVMSDALRILDVAPDKFPQDQSPVIRAASSTSENTGRREST